MGHARNHGGEDELMLESKRYGCLHQEQPEEEEAVRGTEAVQPVCLQDIQEMVGRWRRTPLIPALGRQRQADF